jgi:ABC-type Na+ transport system ATPase subunit NatA
MEEVQAICARVAILDAGRLLVSGTIGELLKEGDTNLEQLFMRLTSRSLRD